jgi:ABC-type Na+ efflux pump permease subunit
MSRCSRASGLRSALTSRYFIVPGLIAIIMTVIGALLTALVVAREWERGTLEALMVTPLTAADFLASKLIPYFLLGMGGMALSVVIGIVVFTVPFRGSFAALTLASAAFMLSALGLGLSYRAPRRTSSSPRNWVSSLAICRPSCCRAFCSTSPRCPAGFRP